MLEAKLCEETMNLLSQGKETQQPSTLIKTHIENENHAQPEEPSIEPKTPPKYPNKNQRPTISSLYQAHNINKQQKLLLQGIQKQPHTHTNKSPPPPGPYRNGNLLAKPFCTR